MSKKKLNFDYIIFIKAENFHLMFKLKKKHWIVLI